MTLLLVPVICHAQEAATPTPRALHDYVAKAEPGYGWKFLGKKGGIYRLELTSQNWQGIEWKHALYIFEPAKLRYPDKVVIYNTGGNIGETPGLPDQLLGVKLAETTGARVVFLMQVPNQPLMGDKVEDDLITETYLRYIETKDPSWPLLFPMVKSVVKAMDAIQEFATSAESGWNQPIDGFLVTGASKRGWTSWLTAVADERVIAIAPIVIDTLNFKAQMKHQLASWGKYSEQIIDYTRKGLVELMYNRPDIPLMSWVDPYTYRRELGLPKLLICGTNDRYWVVDAMHIYWDELVGPKFALYIPNAGHDIERGRDTVLNTIAAFFEQVVTGSEMPKLAWSYAVEGGAVTLKGTSSVPPKEMNLWSAHAETKDFRQSEWTSVPMTGSDGAFTGTLEIPEGRHVALFGELKYEFNGITYSLCTLVKTE
jgi:PhoPQ-activated pathogenicity-related protein